MIRMTRLIWATAAVVLIGLSTASAQTAPKMKMTTPIPDSIITPESLDTRLGKLNFFDGFPDDATSKKIYDNLDFMRGVDAFLNAMPGASVEALRVGLASQGADNNQTILIFENLMDSHSLFLTGNTESIYNLMWLDTKAGPLVIETPPNILGMIDNHWFQYVGDVGNADPKAISCFEPRLTETCSSGAASSKMAALQPRSKTPRNSPRFIPFRKPAIRRR
jgi:hypothetical protein